MQRVPRAFSPGIKWHDSEANPMLDLRQSDQGLHKAKIESIDFTEIFASQK
jgi:hypothetical protein